MTPARTLTLGFAAVAVALAVAAPAATVDYPTLKNGQWDMTTSAAGAGAAPQKSTICLDAATQQSMIDMGVGMQKEMCTRMDMRRDGAKFITDAECKLGNSIVRSHGVMTMSGDTAYRTETAATFDPPLGKDLRESKTVIEGKYAGPCRDGLQPGDMVTPTGQKINVNQMPPRAPKGR